MCVVKCCNHLQVLAVDMAQWYVWDCAWCVCMVGKMSKDIGTTICKSIAVSFLPCSSSQTVVYFQLTWLVASSYRIYALGVALIIPVLISAHPLLGTWLLTAHHRSGTATTSDCCQTSPIIAMEYSAVPSLLTRNWYCLQTLTPAAW